jgi:DNA repair protein RecN (Recombination protein N)
LSVEVADTAEDLRAAVETIEDDPDRLAEVRARRQLLLELTRKYGDTLGDVIAFRAEIGERLQRLTRHEELAAELEQGIAVARVREAAEARRVAAPGLAEAVSRHFPALAMERARLTIAVDGDDPADEVEFLFAANSGVPPLSLSRVASGGELARVMLAVRRVLTAGPPTLVFDEVDAGVGGEAAVAVGRSLGRLGATNQVLVVTHLPQVAAFADRQVVVRKTDDGSSVSSALEPVDGDARVRELARMLAGQPDSAAGREHAAELLALAEQARTGR